LLPLVLGIAWVFLTPPPINGTPEALAWGNFHPDEGSHISVVRYMGLQRLQLPPYAPPYDTSVHPPLYHGLAAIVFRGAASVLDETGALRVVRLVGVLISSATVWYAYHAARQLRMSRAVALPAAFLVAMIPMRVSLSAAVTNENLAALGATATLAILYESLRYGFVGRRFLALVFWCVVAVGSKFTCAGLLLSIFVGLLYAWKWQGQPARVPLVRFASLLGAVAVALGWWFFYNTTHYGDPLRKAAADRLWDSVQPGYAVLGVAKGFAPWRYLVSILGAGWISFWGNFDGMKHRFPLPNYLALFALQIAAFVGVAASLRRLLPRSHVERAIWVVTGVFAAWVILIYCQYNWAHYTPQGRYFFVLLAPFGMLMAGGMAAFLRRFVRSPRWQWAVWSAIGLYLLGLNLYALRVMPTDREPLRQASGSTGGRS
jgi:4-amino-4-deoxy-L-arabinose transferase-like glycosyltransferase